MKDFYNKYVDDIRETLRTARPRNAINKAVVSNFSGITDRSYAALNLNREKTVMLSQKRDLELFESLHSLDEISGKKTNYHLRPGEHPDFIHIRDENSFDNYEIVSVFIDISNSTGLFKKYYPLTVANITNTIQRAAVHTCWYFDGYIQRYHGDGLFVYFGGRKVAKKDAIIQALKATSLFTYFVKNDLKNLFYEQGIENIYTRIGMDFGESEDVLWYMAGMGACSEITTCSLHTSLASKMQDQANSNAIVVGDHVRDLSELDKNLYDYVRDSKKEIKRRYIFEIPEDGFYYTQWDFDWENYLKSLNYNSPNADQNRLNALRQTANLVTAGEAYTDIAGNIKTEPTGVKNQEHRFHYESK